MDKKTSKYFLLLLGLVFVIFSVVVVLPDLLRIDWHEDKVAVVFWFMITAFPLILVYLKDKNASFRNIPKNFHQLTSEALQPNNHKYRKILIYIVWISVFVYFVENLMSYFYSKGV